MDEKMKQKKFTYIAEFLKECNCKKSPFYMCCLNRCKLDRWICNDCYKGKPKESWWKYGNNAFRSKIHYIKLPKPMTLKQINKWMKGSGKKFFRKRKGLIEQKKKIETTFTTKEQRFEESMKKKPLSAPLEIHKWVYGMQIWYYGMLLSFKQIPKIDTVKEDKIILVGIRNKVLRLQMGGLSNTLNYKNGDPEKIEKLVYTIIKQKKLFEKRIKEKKLSYLDRWFMPCKCDKCKIYSFACYSIKNKSKKYYCPKCYKDLTTPKAQKKWEEERK